MAVTQNPVRAEDNARVFETTMERLEAALSGLLDQSAAGAGIEPGASDEERESARVKLGRAHIAISKHALEARAVYAIATRARSTIPDLAVEHVIEYGEAAGLFIVSDAPAPKLAPLQGAVERACPACDGMIVALSATDATMAVPGTFFYEDGDGIPGTPLKFADCDSAIGAMVGKCPHCSARYWALEVLLHSGGEEAVIDILCNDAEWDAHFTAGPNWMAYAVNNAAGRGYQHFIGPLLVPAGMETHGSNGVSACGIEAMWRLMEGENWVSRSVASDAARAVSDRVGPELTPGGQAAHSNSGVSASARGAFWRHALTVFEAYRPRLEAVQRELVQAVAGTEGASA